MLKSNHSNNTQPHLASSVVMVKPIDFGFNPQTAVDNSFQQKPCQSDQQIQTKAMQEFEQAQKVLQKLAIDIITLDKSPSNIAQPDAIFPNNWFSTSSKGQLTIFPMKTPNRQHEIQIDNLIVQLNKSGYQVTETCDLRPILKPDQILEGTGALVFHHPSRQVYTAISERCVSSAVDQYSQQIGYQAVKFNTSSQLGNSVYHSNVVMSCGQDFAILADSVISQEQRKTVIQQLENSVNDLLLISEQQMGHYFCGNLLQLIDPKGQAVIALSRAAYNGFTREQRNCLEQHGSLAVLAIETIEQVGGGSARCMLAENFLSRINS
ncbi:MAG: arginine deiminase-related protein [Enterobacterales bacterium]|nr:arginine deiminase-related protein [Enterobacterales bacterium]